MRVAEVEALVPTRPKGPRILAWASYRSNVLADVGGRAGSAGFELEGPPNSKLLHHPDVADLDFFYEAMHLPDDAGLQFVGFTAEPGSASHDALRPLGSLSAPAVAARCEV
jgi:hypothetical protein